MAAVPNTACIAPIFLFQFMQTVRLLEKSQATTVPSVRKGDVESIPLPLAPLSEQARIVEALNSYQKRETFAYACEAYARILERAPRLRDRSALAKDFATKVRVSAEGVDAGELNVILAAACAARNGWKVILSRCSPES
jgi:hypothetical protein